MGAAHARPFLILILVALAMLAGVAGLPGAMAQAPPTKADIDAELESAKLDRDFAVARLAKVKEPVTFSLLSTAAETLRRENSTRFDRGS